MISSGSFKTACLAIACMTLSLITGSSAWAVCRSDILSNRTSFYHGTPVAEFVWFDQDRPVEHPRTPDGPAWFAFDEEFSVHAAVRLVRLQVDANNNLLPAALQLHRYRLSARTTGRLLTCDTHAEFIQASRIRGNRMDGTERADSDLAADFCASANWGSAPVDAYDGYRILQDRVRGEPELILCDPIGAAQHVDTAAWSVGLADGRKAAIGTKFADGATYFCKLGARLVDFDCARAVGGF